MPNKLKTTFPFEFWEGGAEKRQFHQENRILSPDANTRAASRALMKILLFLTRGCLGLARTTYEVCKP